MKTLYLKTTMKLLRRLPALIFFLLALSYNVRSQTAIPNPVCYGQPINLFCAGLYGCGLANATYTWTNYSGSWTYTAIGDAYVDPSINVGEDGYAADKFYLQVQFIPPPGGFSGGRVTVILRDSITIAGTTTPVICFGTQSGTITLNVTGGQPAYTYLWNDGITTKDRTGLAAGSYYVTVTDALLCSQVSDAFVIEESSSALTLEGLQDSVSCFEGSDGAINILPGGGTTPYTFLWSNTLTTQNLTGLAAGWYTVTVTDHNACTITGSWEVFQPTQVVVTGDPTDVSCFEGTNGTIEITPGGGTPPYTFLWNDPAGSTTQNVTGLSEGTYTVTVTDHNGCPATGSWYVGQPTQVTVDGIVTEITCNGADNGAINITADGGTPPYSYSWSHGPTTEDVSGLAPGCYTVTVTDSLLCTGTAVFCLQEPAPIVVTEELVTDASCKETCDGTITYFVTGGVGGFTFLWSPGGETTQNLTDLCEGTYTVTITDANLCPLVDTFTVGAPDSLLVTGDASSASCATAEDGNIDITVTGGTTPYSFVWSPGGETTQNISGLAEGWYTVSVTDMHSCSVTGSWYVSEPGEVSWFGSLTDVSCKGSCNGTITTIETIGGTPPYTYAWSLEGVPFSTESNLTGLCAGNYSLVVTDAHSCDARAFRTISEPDSLLVSPNAVITPALCYHGTGGAIEITVTGGTPDYSFIWSNGATTKDISGLAPGCYTVTVTDALSCDADGMFCVGEPDSIRISFESTDALCKGSCEGTISAFVSGGTSPYSYLWNDPAGSTTSDVSNLCEGTYAVTVTDAHSCEAFGSWTIGAPDSLLVTGDPSSASCATAEDGRIDITVIGGTSPYSFVWSPNGETTQNISGLAEGWYTVSVTDYHSCSVTGSWYVSEPGEVSWFGSLTNVSCKGSCNGTITTIETVGGTPPYTYAWSLEGVPFSTESNLTGLCAGNYSLVVTDAHSCDARAFRTITEPDSLLISPDAVIVDALCYHGTGGSIDITVTGGTPGYSYSWSNGATTEDISGLSPGCYTVTVTDTLFCQDSRTFCVGEPDSIIISHELTDALCKGSCDGTISVFVSGGTSPYSYLWNDPAGTTTYNVGDLCEGTYAVTVTDAHSCEAYGSWTIGAPDSLLVTGDPSSASCATAEDGRIDITVTGGTSPYSFVWSPGGETTQNISGLAEGWYTVSVTDYHSCSVTGSWYVSEPGEVSWFGSLTNVSCKGSCNGTITTIETVGGTPPYTYAWSLEGVPFSTESNLTGLCAGNYSLVVTDAHSCDARAFRTITEPDSLLISPDAIITPALCYNGTGGAIEIAVTGGTEPYEFLWSNGETTKDISGLSPGCYTVTVTDALSCDTDAMFCVGEPDSIMISHELTDALCKGSCDGTISVYVSGGTSPYTYLWNDPAGSTTSTIDGLCEGTYAVTVSDSHSCEAYGSWTIGAPDSLLVTGDPSSASCATAEDGTIDITVTGGTPGYSFIWSPGGETTQNISGLAEGWYTVSVTDSHSCSVTGSWYVSEPGEVSWFGSLTNVSCKGSCNGTITTIETVGGTPPYTYAWSLEGLPFSTESNLTGLCAGNYSLVVTDAHSCDARAFRTITEPDSLLIGEPVVVTNVTCHGGVGFINGGVIITPTDTTILSLPVTGGTEPYSFEWSNGTTDSVLCCVPAGCYTVTVTDANSCEVTGSWCITEPDALSLEASVTDILCHGDSTGAINLTVFGGTPDYSYSWSTSATTEDISGLGAGVYTVTVEDANGCVITGSWEVFQPTQLVVDLATPIDPCNGTDKIDIVVTGGTPDYTFEWSNGETTQNISGLIAGCYTVTVTDANTCETTGTWCITAPWYLHLSGDTLACCNSAELSTYYANVTGWLGLNGPQTLCTPDDITYEWVVVGGVITSGWNTPYITVDWDCCIHGTVTVTATRCDGCQLSETLDVTVSLPPAPILIGPSTVFVDSVNRYCVESAVPGHLYSWSVPGGSYTTVPGTNCIDVVWSPFPICGCGIVIVCETDPLTGCMGCDTLFITVLPNPEPVHGIWGYVVYDGRIYNPGPPITADPLLTPLNGVTIQLYNKVTGTVDATTVSGPNMNGNGEPGYWQFDIVPNLTDYKLMGSYNGTWGGNNATDALLIQLQVINSTIPPYLPMAGLQKIAADVNGTSTITGLDALYVKLRTIGMISSYPAGDWKFSNNDVTALGLFGTDGNGFRGLCVGDVNGSFIPTGLKDASFLSVVDDETQTVPVEQTFAYQIRSNMVAQLGAMTLFMGYDKDRFEVIDVIASSNDEMKYVIEDGNVAIAWADANPMTVRNNDELFTLTVKAKAPITDATQIFNVKTGSEFASPSGYRYDNFNLKMSPVITPGGSKEFTITNYPNPFNSKTDIVYTLPESGRVHLVVTDLLGKTIATLVDQDQTAGTYTISVNPSNYNMKQGIFLYQIDVNGATENFVKVNKMIFTK